MIEIAATPVDAARNRRRDMAMSRFLALPCANDEQSAIVCSQPTMED
jgi:hypothetical protein